MFSTRPELRTLGSKCDVPNAIRVGKKPFAAGSVGADVVLGVADVGRGLLLVFSLLVLLLLLLVLLFSSGRTVQ